MVSFSDIYKGLWSPRADRLRETSAGGSLDAFSSERSRDEPEVGRPSVPFAPAGNRRSFALLLLVGGAIGLGLGGYILQKWPPFQVEAASVSLTIESVPAGAEVFAGGVRQGTTPLTLPVAPGEHVFELVHDGRRTPLRAVARAGAATVHHVQLTAVPSVVAPAAEKASLRIITEPARLRVAVDGVPLGLSPVIADNITPGSHAVQVRTTQGTHNRRVHVAAGETASVIIAATPKPATLPAAGWLTVTSAVPLDVLEGAEVVGTSQSARIMLPAGRHELQFVNQPLGFAVRRSVRVDAAGTSVVSVEMPSAPLSVNALPWAQVWVDGVPLGETPIGNHQVRLGTHEILFRHPEHGERRETVVVSLHKPARVSVDMRKP